MSALKISDENIFGFSIKSRSDFASEVKIVTLRWSGRQINWLIEILANALIMRRRQCTEIPVAENRFD